MLTASAQAQPNIALIKYWGKRDADLNLPAVGSLSVTLDALQTHTTVRFDSRLDADAVRLNGRSSARQSARVSACLDLLRQRAGTTVRARVESTNNFPTGAGLASSASGFAALVKAADAALELGLDQRELSVLARRGSGSAARSMVGGFAEMAMGERDDGHDAFARQLLAPSDWPLAVVVAVTSRESKTTGSTDGMTQSHDTSPFYDDWVATAPDDLAAARDAVKARDFDALAALSEYSCLKMHAVMMATRPGLVYWNGTTVDCLHRVRSLREQDGLGVFFTIDAGPQLKAVCRPGDVDDVARALEAVPGVEDVLTSRLGPGARVLPADASIAGRAS